MKNLATALVRSQKEFSPALKNSVNPAFKNSATGGRYADLASCIDAVMDALNNNGIALIQKCYDCPDAIMVETMFVHESGEMLECGILRFPTTKNDPQGFMSALTYARRGSLMSACGIAPEDDDGNASSDKEPEKQTLTDKRLSDAVARIKEGQYTTVKLREQFALTKAQEDFVVKALANA
jgi:hypothetical protein